MKKFTIILSSYKKYLLTAVFERVEEDVTEFEETPVQSTMAEDNL